MKKNHRIVSLLLAALMAIGLMTTAFAAEPTINTGKRASLNIYKYDITTASADGAWDAESYVSTDLHDDAVIDKLAKYAVQGVEFTYLRVADIAMNNELVNGRRRVGVLYGFDGADAVLPAIGVRREEVGELFEREFGTEHGNSDPTYLTHEARRQLRPKFLGADIAMTGVNFAVASTGTLAVCTNEGNADMGTSFPDLHIAIMGLEKVIPDMRALAVFTRLLARSGTGQPVTSYTSLYRKPAPGKRIHVVIVDNGRSEWLADAAHRNMLKCLRCGACMNTCPVYRRSGGYSYSYFIPGPLGINLSMLRSPKLHHGNVSACSLCYSCSDVCPAMIDLGEQIYAWRQELAPMHLADPVKKLTVKGMDFIMGGRRRFYGGIALARVAEHLPHAVLNNRFNPWSAPGRDMPPFAPKTFNALWKRGEVKSGKTSKDE